MEELKEEGFFSKIFDKILDYVISLKENKTHLYLWIIVLIGLILRIIAMINISWDGDSPHYMIHAINFTKSGLLTSWNQSAGLWYFLTSIMYSIFGFSYITARILTLFVSTLTIIAIFLFTKEFFKNEKAALISAMFFAFYSGSIKMTIAFMHAMVLLLLIMGMYYLLKAERTNKNRYYLIAFLYFGVSQMLKAYTVLFCPGIVLFMIGNKIIIEKKDYREVIKDKLLWKRIFLFGVIMILSFSPIAIYNYLLYKYNGHADMQFTRMFGLYNEKADRLFSWDPGYHQSFNPLKLFWKGNYANTPDIITLISYFFALAPFITILFFFSLIYSIKNIQKNPLIKKYLLYWVLVLLFPMFYLISVLTLPKQIIFFPAFFIPLISYSLFKDIRITRKKFIGLLIIFLFFCLFALSITYRVHENFYYKKPNIQLFDVGKNIQENSLVIQDPRIYGGYVLLSFFKAPIITPYEFQEIMNLNQNLSDQIWIDLYFIRKIEDKESSLELENYFNVLENQTEVVKIIYDKDLEVHYLENENISKGTMKYTLKDPVQFNLGYWKFYNPFISHPKEIPVYKIHKTQISFSKSLLDYLKTNRYFLLHPVGYNTQINHEFYYDPIYTPDKILNKFAFFIMYLGIILFFILTFNSLAELIRTNNY